jgi:hypothetical protein
MVYSVSAKFYMNDFNGNFQDTVARTDHECECVCRGEGEDTLRLLEADKVGSRDWKDYRKR